MHRFIWLTPSTLEQAATEATTIAADAMLQAPNGKLDQGVLLAGGIDLLDLFKEGLLAPARVINLKAVGGLDTVSVTAEGYWRLGALLTLDALAEHPQIRQHYPALGEAAAGSASPQIRHVATLGGNLLQRPRCWYFRSSAFHCLRKGGGHCFALAGENQYHAVFDNHSCAIVHPSTLATVLVALAASVELADAQGNRRQVALEQFLIGPGQDLQRENALRPGEILTAVLLPSMAPQTRMAHLRQGERAAFDWPLADVAVLLEADNGEVCRRAVVVLGAAAPTPHRAREAETMLTGQRVSETLARSAAQAALAGATPLSKNAYKLPLFEALVYRAILAATHHG